ncbi:MAG TPA: hypothetical protein VKF36_01245 [Syntrophorhabdales bacterium]|nr:hypothetical protein [Syntrophorhabdales bacterium]
MHVEPVQRSILKPFSLLALSVQDRLIWLLETAVADKLLGALSVTVPRELYPPKTVEGFKDNELSMTAGFTTRLTLTAWGLLLAPAAPLHYSLRKSWTTGRIRCPLGRKRAAERVRVCPRRVF